ncbi:MAG TPA: TIGR03619 family F420-dependent LLM class oxidoreductase [Streptosporangiaceae bacterium]|nr:TIGR03619 family F420-dependent LLM class oxidoreductase [Streptosporangiaceae bacterium]
MKIGFGLPVSGAWATPENIASFASKADQAGYSSLWSFQRLLVPEGSGMDPVYQSVLDPMAALSFAAAVTSRIRLAVAVINAPFVAPIYLAKQAASLDILSVGRHDLGIGLGWMPEEFASTGAAMARRGARMEEYVRVLRTIWGAQPAEFSGEFYSIPRGLVAPGPVQPGGPPILLGGTAPRALRRVGQISDGWVTSSRADLARIGESIAIVREAAAGAGRAPESLRIICRGVVRYGEPVNGPDGRLLLSGSEAQIRADIEWLASNGVTEVFYDLNWDPQVGAPDADPRAAAERASRLLELLRPAP